MNIEGLKKCFLISLLFIFSAPLSFSTAQLANPELTLTSGSLAQVNLESQIASARMMISRNPENPGFQRELFDLISTRSQFFGSYNDFREMRVLADRQPEDVVGLLVRSRYHSTIHEFSQARELVERAAQLEPNNPEVRRQRAKINVALREELEATRTLQLSAVDAEDTYAERLLLASIEAELGNFDEADKQYQLAIDRYRDASPFPVAFIEFQRGVLWAEKANNPERGRELYQRALQYLPQYVVATVHHAELLHEIGQTENAVERLRTVISSQDPEPRGLLAELLRAQGQESEPSELVASATSMYNDLLREFPLAFADHAAEFFSGPGEDAKRGFALAEQNLANRQNERAYIVAIEAALAATIDNSRFCALVKAAEALPPRYINLIELLKNTSSTACKS